MTKSLIAAALLGLVAVGCGQSQPRKMTVGVVNTERVVQELPEFREMNLDWAADTGGFLSSIPSTQADMNKKKAEELNQRIARSSEVWKARSSKFYQDAWGRITNASAVVAKQRGLDMVVIDTVHMPSVQYTSGENITTDILIQLSHDSHEKK